MSRNFFRENRKRVQQNILDSNFLLPLVANTSICIEEKKAKYDNHLKKVIIENIPVSPDDIRPQSWLIELEIEHPTWGMPQGGKKAEKAIVVLGSDAMRIFIFEMKTTLEPFSGSNPITIFQKFEHSINRILSLLPIYIFENEYNDMPLYFKAIVFYNHEKWTSVTDENFKIQNRTILKCFQNGNGHIEFENMGVSDELELFFFRNSNSNLGELIVDFRDFFIEEWEHNAAIEGNLTCPILKSMPN